MVTPRLSFDCPQSLFLVQSRQESSVLSLSRIATPRKTRAAASASARVSGMPNSETVDQAVPRSI